MSFINNLKDTINNEKTLTENGAVGYRTTGKNLLDLNFAVSSMRGWSDNLIEKKFADAFYEDKLLALKWLFFLGDVRGGLGERRSFRVCLRWLSRNQPWVAKAVLKLVPEYTRWDNLISLLDTPLADEVNSIIKRQLKSDVREMELDHPISLLAKWLPSENATSKRSRDRAIEIAGNIGMTMVGYRKTLSRLRKYLDVIEVKMSKNAWGVIDYSKVPSKANLIYNKAFLRHDEERRRQYLSQLEKGETKINAGVLFPHDIVHNYTISSWRSNLKAYDETLEQLWKALPDYANGASNTICVADGSGSMSVCIGNTHTSALEIANALAIYFAERCSGDFKDTYITFSNRPQLVDFSQAATLKEKLEIALQHNEVANTNVEAVFDLVLETAVRSHMDQEDLPRNILILSDMEFDSATTQRTGQTLFDHISQKFQNHGYQMPRLIFWNINSRSGAIPIKSNECGVALVSGFSPAIINMVLSNELDPFRCLLNQLNSERYQAVENAIKDVI